MDVKLYRTTAQVTRDFGASPTEREDSERFFVADTEPTKTATLDDIAREFRTALCGVTGLPEGVLFGHCPAADAVALSDFAGAIRSFWDSPEYGAAPRYLIIPESLARLSRLILEPWRGRLKGRARLIRARARIARVRKRTLRRKRTG